MHQQPGDRSCKNEAIGGAHYGPVTVYLSKVADASTADGSAGWFKIFQDGWAKVWMNNPFSCIPNTDPGADRKREARSETTIIGGQKT
jgi:hypothetical protein